MLRAVQTVRRDLSLYAPLVSGDLLRRARAQAAPLDGTRVLHLTAEPAVGIHEPLPWLVPLCQALGIHAEWRTLDQPGDISRARRFSDLRADELPSAANLAWAEVASTNYRLALDLQDGDWDVGVVHGTALGLTAAIIPEACRAWVWRPGDLSSASPALVERLAPLLDGFDATVVEHVAQLGELAPRAVHVIEPTIGPLPPRPLPAALAQWLDVLTSVAGVHVAKRVARTQA